MKTISLHLRDTEAMMGFGHRLARAYGDPLVVYLYGPLGVGKTTLVRGVLRGLGYLDTVKSPTYALLESYECSAFRLHHFDLYRLVDARELEHLGLRDELDGQHSIWVEWPERGGPWLPLPDLSIILAYAQEGRYLQLSAESLDGQTLLAALGQMTEVGRYDAYISQGDTT